MRSEAERVFERLEARVLEAEGRTESTQRRAAARASTMSEEIEVLLAKVRCDAARITDDDLAAVQRAGYDDDAVFELTVAAAVGVARRRLDNALAALAAVEQEEAR